MQGTAHGLEGCVLRGGELQEAPAAAGGEGCGDLAEFHGCDARLDEGRPSELVEPEGLWGLCS
jgi:hypothetical protein